MIAQCGLYLRRWVMLWCSYVLFAANISMSIVVFVMMQIWRWSHAGRVCAGEFLPDGEDCEPSTYNCFEGKFLKYMLITIYSVFFISFISVFVVSMIVHSKHKAEEKIRAE